MESTGVSEYELRNGINYRQDGYAFCDRCGRTPIVNDKCIYCDVLTAHNDHELARQLMRYCFNERTERQPGFRDMRYESFDVEKAARIIAAWHER